MDRIDDDVPGVDVRHDTTDRLAWIEHAEVGGLPRSKSTVQPSDSLPITLPFIPLMVQTVILSPKKTLDGPSTTN